MGRYSNAATFWTPSVNNSFNAFVDRLGSFVEEFEPGPKDVAEAEENAVENPSTLFFALFILETPATKAPKVLSLDSLGSETSTMALA